MGIACLHVIEGGVEAGIHGQIKVLSGVGGQGHAGGGGLGVVDEHIDTAEGLDGLVDDMLHHGLVVAAGGHVGLDREHPDAVEPLQLLLGVLQLLYVAAGDDQVHALLGEGGGNAVADGAAALAVAEDGPAGAGNDGDLTLHVIIHGVIPP